MNSLREHQAWPEYRSDLDLDGCYEVKVIGGPAQIIKVGIIQCASSSIEHWYHAVLLNRSVLL